MSSSKETIQEKSRQLEELGPRLDQASEAFIVEAQAFAQEWISKKARELVISEAAVVESLGTEGIEGLKREVDGLVASAPELVRESFARAGSWPHKGPAKNSFSSSDSWHLTATAKGQLRSSTPPDGAVEPFRPVFGRLGSLMADKGIVKLGYERTDWRKPTQGPGSPVTYASYIELSPALIDASNVYGTLYAEFRKCSKELESAKEQDSKETVGSIWDEA